MKLCFVLLAAALLAWCAVDARPGTTKKEDLDGIGDDLDDFFKHKDQQNSHRQSDSNVYRNQNQNTWLSPNYKKGRGAASALQPHAPALLGALKKPASSGSDILGDLLNGFRGGQGGSSSLGSLGSLGSLAGFGGLNTRPSNPPSSVQYPSRPASVPSSSSSGAHYPSVPAAPASAPASRPSSAQYPSRPASNVPSYPSYPSYPSGGSGSQQSPAGAGWVVPGGSSGNAAGSYPSYPSSYPSNYPSYPSYTNYQRGNPNPNPYPAYPGYQQPGYHQPAYQQPAYQQPAMYQPTYSGPQTVQRYDPRNPPPAPTKSSGSSISKFFKKIFS